MDVIMQPPCQKKTWRDELCALVLNRGKVSVLKKYIDIFYLHLFFFRGHSSHSVYPPAFGK